MLKHKLIELTTCFDQQMSEMCLFNKVLNQVGQQFTDESPVTFHQYTQVPNISDMDTTAAPADIDIDKQFARAKSLADYEKQTEIRAKQMIAGVTQDAVSALLQQEQRFTQQRAQEHAQAAADIQQIRRQAQVYK